MQNYKKKTITSRFNIDLPSCSLNNTKIVKIIALTNELEDLVQSLKNQGKTIGFVPTMGALHAGHMSLIQEAKKQCDFVIASVFVNPTQFNNSEDLKLYPRTPEADATLLEANGCDVAFFPTVDTMYPSNYSKITVDLEGLDLVLEGKFRPGHFEGVVEVVGRFFTLVKPDKAFFGLKDFQQVAVIKHMVKVLQMPLEIVPVETKREEAGLAMSSRNVRLNENERKEALHIYKSLKFAQERAKTATPEVVREETIRFFESSEMELEYLEIVHPETLQSLTTTWVENAVMCIACFCGPVRLIDNMLIK